MVCFIHYTLHCYHRSRMSQQASTSKEVTASKEVSRDSPLRLVIKGLGFGEKRVGGKRPSDNESPRKGEKDKRRRASDKMENKEDLENDQSDEASSSECSEAEVEAEMNGVEAAGAESTKGKKGKNKKSKKSKNKEQSGSELNPAMIQAVKEAVKGCMVEMMPDIIRCITETINETVKNKLDELDEKVATLTLRNDQTRVLSVMESDRQEQYQRRDNIIVQGIREVEEENTDQLIERVVELCDSVGVRVEKAAIGDIHRLGKNRGAQNKARPVLLKTNRLVKNEIMQKKRRLRGMAMDREKFEEKISMYEDLTEARRKLREAARDAPDVAFCYTRDGTIMCRTKNDQWVDVNCCNDLLKVGLQGEQLDPSRYYKGLI